MILRLVATLNNSDEGEDDRSDGGGQIILSFYVLNYREFENYFGRK